MAVTELFNAQVIWHVEYDQAPSQILKHHYPQIPNYGDITKVDFTQVPKVNILTGGFPCQDLSLAGKRAGLKDGTRSGLWSYFAEAIETIQPDWIIIENVKGLLSAKANSTMEYCTDCMGETRDKPVLFALGAVLADLAQLGYNAQWQNLQAAQAGAPHRRERIFILAWPVTKIT
jgi:DNA (cytosine-5)-methyltransferase 1